MRVSGDVRLPAWRHPLAPTREAGNPRQPSNGRGGAARGFCGMEATALRVRPTIEMSLDAAGAS
jgi:hypothetical protein